MVIRTRTDFIPLDRTFHDLKAEAEGSDDVEMHRMFGGSATGWKELQSEHRVVLLAEAGAGKTEEIRQAALRLREGGQAAFFMRIEHVVDDFADAFEVGDALEFDAWIESTSEGWLFLDSVDEARLRDAKDFERAMRQVARRIEPALQRTHLFVASRATAWRPATDLTLCARLFPYFPKIAPVDPVGDYGDWLASAGPAPEPREVVERPPFRVVALDDLSPGQIRTFLQARGVDDARAFLDAVERADAGMFTARPQDLEELTGFWRQSGRIGSRLDIMRASIDRRLVERDQDRAEAQPLSPERAREGARLLAAASTLMRQPLICVPDGAQAGEGLRVESVLTGWEPAECLALLARPVFDEAIYGAVRFHHRSVREYLAAEWLAGLMHGQGSRRRVEQLFFKEQYGVPVIVPALRPLLPWLVLLDQRILDRTLAVAPEVIFEGGDPRQLPPETRRRVLRDVCREMGEPAHGRSFADYAAVQRFAGPDIADEMREQLRLHGANDDVVYFLMQMIWHGEIKALRAEVKNVAMTSGEKYARMAAFKALAATGSRCDMDDVRAAMLDEPGDVRRSWLAELLDTLPRDADGAKWLMKALRKVKPRKPHGVDRLTRPMRIYTNSVPIDVVATMAKEMAGLLVQSPLTERRGSRISERDHGLASPTAGAICRLINLEHTAALRPDLLSMLRRLSLTDTGHDAGVDRAYRDLPGAVRSWPQLNHQLFWLSVAEARAERSPDEGPLVDWWNISNYGAYWAFGADDFERIVEDVASRDLADDRHVALSLAFRLYSENGRPRRWRDRLKRVAASDDALSAKLALLLRPPPAGRSKWRRSDWEWNQKAEAGRARGWADEEAWRIRLRSDHGHLRETAGGRLTGDHQHLLERMRSARRGSGSRSEADWRFLATEFGDDVALAFRDGAVAAWRATTPPLVSEGASRVSTAFASVFGLAGLAIEAAETDRWAEGMSATDAGLATRYALEEINGFPPWLPALYAAHPDTVIAIVLEEIAYEVATDTGERESWYLLYDASWAGQWMWDRLAPGIMPMFAPEPKSDGNLRYMLTIVEGGPTSDAALAALASEKTMASEGDDRAAVWAATWTGVDPSVAIPAFAARLDGIADASARTGAAMRYLTTLLGTRRHVVSARQAFRTVEHLETLYLLAERHVRREDDVHRAGTGVYSPDLRDDAQDARSAIFSLLNEISGKAAYLALMNLSRLHPDGTSRPWMVMHARQRAAADADAGPWTATQMRQFADTLERTPSTHRELWELAGDRLLDLKHDLEEGDGSIAPVLMRARDEMELRNFIGNWCRDRAAGRYSISQEEELADAKRPDLRFQGTGFDAPVPVELKIADNWSGPQLFERFENQLCGDNLRDSRSGRGIYLLVYLGTKSSWDLPGGGRANGFNGLVQALQELRASLLSRSPHVEDVEVIGIDLTKRRGRSGLADGS